MSAFAKWKTGFFVHHIPEIWKTADRLAINEAVTCKDEGEIQSRVQKQTKTISM